MANQHIEISNNPAASRFASDVRQLIDSLRSVQQQSIKAKDIAQQIASGGDFVALGAALGTSAANAEIVYNLLVGLDLDTASINQIIDRLG